MSANSAASARLVVKPQASSGGVGAEEFGQAVLVDGALAGVEAVDLRLVQVHADDLVADLGHGSGVGDA